MEQHGLWGDAHIQTHTLYTHVYCNIAVLWIVYCRHIVVVCSNVLCDVLFYLVEVIALILFGPQKE
jgi:hypothetical protein